MPRHSLFPGFIKITYTSNAHVHHQVLPIDADPTAVGDSFTIPTRGSGAVDWKTAVDNWITVLKPFFAPGSSFDLAELYNFEAEPGPADFLQAYEIAEAATGDGSAVHFVQAVFPFKGVAGSQLRVTFLESREPQDKHAPYASMSSEEKAIVDFILGADDWIITRAGGFPTVSLGVITKINDQLRKRYFNP